MGQFRAAQKYLRSECAGLFVLRYAAGPAKLTQQVEQQQDAPEDGIGGVEVPQQNRSAPRSCLSSAILFSMSAR